MKNLEIAAYLGIFAVDGGTVAYFYHFFFSKFVVADKFGKSLVVVSVIVEEESGNSVRFAFFKFVGVNGKVISCVGSSFCGNSVAIIGNEFNFFTLGNNVPFAVIAKNMKFKSIIERKTFCGFVFPAAANGMFVVEIIFILCGENNVIVGFGIIRLCFFKFSAAGKNKDKAKNQKNNFFQNQCVLSWDDKSINTHYNTFMQ